MKKLFTLAFVASLLTSVNAFAVIQPDGASPAPSPVTPPQAPAQPSISHAPQPAYYENGSPVFANTGPRKVCHDNAGHKMRHCPVPINAPSTE